MNNITILGSNSAIPSIEKFTSSQFVNINGTGILVDCGEGTQIRMQMNNIKPNSIDYILISHLHGDHFFGLIGLISTMHMQNRHKPLYIFGPEHLEEIINLQLKVSLTELQFECIYKVTNPDEFTQIIDAKNFDVFSIPLNHKLPTTGFLFKSKMKNKTFSYAYISDTMYKPDIVPYIKDIDILYHEATYTHDLVKNAVETYQTTTIEAATIAKMANVKKLLIGHFSKRHINPAVMIGEAKSVFENTVAVKDHNVIEF